MKFRIKKQRKIEMGIGWSYYRDGVSSSFILSWLMCREKAKFQFIDRFRRTAKGVSALRFGSFFHNCLELVPAGHSAESIVQAVLNHWQNEEGLIASVEMHEAYESIAGKAESLLKGYVKFWTDDQLNWIGIEQYFKVPFLNTQLVGIFDGVYLDANDSVWLMETKTRARIDIKVTTEMLTFDLQTQLYLLALRFWLDSIPEYAGKRIAGVKYNVIRKPQLKQKKTEELHQYLARVDADVIERPEFYYKRVENACSEHSNQLWARETLTPIIKEIERWALKEAAHYRNVAACQDQYGLCDYFPICARNDRSVYRVKSRAYEHHPIKV